MGIGYFIVGFFATTIGAMVGLGGGVIIKPVLDAIGSFDIASICVLSSATVLAMSVVALARAFMGEMRLRMRVALLLAIGSVIGGVLGKILFVFLLERSADPAVVKMIQAMILIVLLIVVFISINLKKQVHTLNLKNPVLIILVGVFLGGIASFLGVGGGPFNVIILSLLFTMGIKEAALNSLFIIFCAQSANLLRIYFSTGFSDYDLSVLGWMVMGGVLGGLVGSALLRYLKVTEIHRVFNVTLVLTIALNIYNMFS